MDILLADDEARVRAALRLVCEQESDLRVVGEADSGQQLLAALMTTDPDVILLDWELPGPSAPALLATIRVLCPDTVVVALSGRIEAYRAAMAVRVDAFVSKVDPPERLLGTLRVIARAPRGGDTMTTLPLLS